MSGLAGSVREDRLVAFGMGVYLARGTTQPPKFNLNFLAVRHSSEANSIATKLVRTSSR
jgi:hypothetical protein